ncbi:hypothetical protein [Streptosporangium roseum]|uniref:hypothetical protein n=1 Tax=Streptosporangium roseum TaxID=2001 RepID=UPI00331837CF
MEDSRGQVIWFSLGDSDFDTGPATYLAPSRREKLKDPESDSRYLLLGEHGALIIGNQSDHAMQFATTHDHTPSSRIYHPTRE